ncbi:uncharacterized protein AMSG_04400 [Thecamonas trahens ATCC 50062]|uniref:Uncharacterized protein n=1 Tax=Thecamonas trahens ATCC 50062 TaxID=461836 RepID=A0A0L0D7Y0_THETB|nr:hypothetical protein AMSG_04400 [Thecamonas trahens ATCC 50062]KNC48171.1 hypothetical protein AMSG_04400 [Thecamonas trahens ATCC 50062]|eukprot:XP_013758741.1 hypothetical protein AMSG_04400 [Thecamonas trahens ATCC 50062]
MPVLSLGLLVSAGFRAQSKSGGAGEVLPADGHAGLPRPLPRPLRSLSAVLRVGEDEMARIAAAHPPMQSSYTDDEPLRPALKTLTKTLPPLASLLAADGCEAACVAVGRMLRAYPPLLDAAAAPEAAHAVESNYAVLARLYNEVLRRESATLDADLLAKPRVLFLPPDRLASTASALSAVVADADAGVVRETLALPRSHYRPVHESGEVLRASFALEWLVRKRGGLGYSDFATIGLPKTPSALRKHRRRSWRKLRLDAATGRAADPARTARALSAKVVDSAAHANRRIQMRKRKRKRKTKRLDCQA